MDRRALTRSHFMPESCADGGQAVVRGSDGATSVAEAGMELAVDLFERYHEDISIGG
jgi:hypothetical protein